MHRTLHGALMGLLIGGPATMLSYQVLHVAASSGSSKIYLFILGWIAWGAVLGRVMPKHK